jgi:hypothetical protein
VCGCFRIDPPPISGEEESAQFYTDYYAKGRFAEADGSGARQMLYAVARLEAGA